MRFLSGDEIGFLHTRIIEATGGLPGVRDETVLHSIPTRIRLTCGGTEMFNDIFTKGAMLFTEVLSGQPFHDGNKRAAAAATAVFLTLNGRALTATEPEVVELAKSAEAGTKDVAAIGDWLRTKSEVRG